MKRAALVAACLLVAVTVQAQEPPTLSAVLVLRARIVQLEAQLVKVSADEALCAVRLAFTAQSQQEPATNAGKQQLEKEAGCAIDWQANPPLCKATK